MIKKASVLLLLIFIGLLVIPHASYAAGTNIFGPVVASPWSSTTNPAIGRAGLQTLSSNEILTLASQLQTNVQGVSSNVVSGISITNPIITGGTYSDSAGLLPLSNVILTQGATNMLKLQAGAAIAGSNYLTSIPVGATNQFLTTVPVGATNSFLVNVAIGSTNQFATTNLVAAATNGLPNGAFTVNPLTSVPVSATNQFLTAIPVSATNWIIVQQTNGFLSTADTNSLKLQAGSAIAGSNYLMMIPVVATNQFLVAIPVSATNQFLTAIPVAATNQFLTSVPVSATNWIIVQQTNGYISLADTNMLKAQAGGAIAGSNYLVTVPVSATNQFLVSIPTTATNQFLTAVPIGATNWIVIQSTNGHLTLADTNMLKLQAGAAIAGSNYLTSLPNSATNAATNLVVNFGGSATGSVLVVNNVFTLNLGASNAPTANTSLTNLTTNGIAGAAAGMVATYNGSTMTLSNPVASGGGVANGSSLTNVSLYGQRSEVVLFYQTTYITNSVVTNDLTTTNFFTFTNAGTVSFNRTYTRDTSDPLRTVWTNANLGVGKSFISGAYYWVAMTNFTTNSSAVSYYTSYITGDPRTDMSGSVWFSHTFGVNPAPGGSFNSVISTFATNYTAVVTNVLVSGDARGLTNSPLSYYPPEFLTNRVVGVVFIGDSIMWGFGSVSPMIAVTNYIAGVAAQARNTITVDSTRVYPGYSAHYIATNQTAAALTNVTIVVNNALINDLRYGMTNFAPTPAASVIIALQLCISNAVAAGVADYVLYTPTWVTYQSYTNATGQSSWNTSLYFTNNNGFSYDFFLNERLIVRKWILNQVTNTYIRMMVIDQEEYSHLSMSWASTDKNNTWDGLHPNVAGSALMASATIRAIQTRWSPQQREFPQPWIMRNSVGDFANYNANQFGQSETVFNTNAATASGIFYLTLPLISQMGQELLYFTSRPLTNLTVNVNNGGLWNNGTLASSVIYTMASNSSAIFRCVQSSRDENAGGAQWTRVDTLPTSYYSGDGSGLTNLNLGAYIRTTNTSATFAVTNSASRAVVILKLAFDIGVAAMPSCTIISTNTTSTNDFGQLAPVLLGANASVTNNYNFPMNPNDILRGTDTSVAGAAVRLISWKLFQ